MAAPKQASEVGPPKGLSEALGLGVEVEVAAHHKGSALASRQRPGRQSVQQGPCENAGPAVAIGRAK
eukprot:1590740-Alexandrium_andersonii.AAC.1